MSNLPFCLRNTQSALVVGAGHGIGLGLVKHINELAPEVSIWSTYRSYDHAQDLLTLAELNPNIKALCVDPSQEDSLSQLCQNISESSKGLDLLINTVGVLHDEQVKPEKSMKYCSMDNLLHYFKVNACIAPLLAKVFMNLLKASQCSVFASISAKVGSIGDNQLGGWYGYRASKAALNMFIKTIALEFVGRRMSTMAFAIHPGTTYTQLSEPYIARTKLKVHSAEESARNIMAVLEGKSLDDTGTFWSWDGSQIQW